MITKLSFLLVFCFGISFADCIGYCCDTEDEAQVLFNYYYLECVSVGAPRLEGGVYNYGVSGSKEYCISASCNNCENISDKRIINVCCNSLKVEPVSNYRSNCMIMAQSGIGISVPNVRSEDFSQFCSNSPAGSGSNICQVEMSSSSSEEDLSSSSGDEDDQSSSSVNDNSSSSGGGGSSALAVMKKKILIYAFAL